MKKTFLVKRNRLLSARGASRGALMLAAVLLLLATRLVAPDAFIRLMSPLWQIGRSLSAGTAAMRAGFSDAAALGAENQRLANENAVLALKNAALETEVADIAGLAVTPPSVIAGVLAAPPVSPYGSLVIAAGSADGVSAGYEVFGPGDTPLGLVASATAHAARITLFSASGRQSRGWVGGSRLPLILTGAGSGAFSAEVPRDAGVREGDLVYLPGPGALSVGTVIQIASEPASPLATLRIRPLLNPFSLTWVRIGTHEISEYQGRTLIWVNTFSDATATPRL